jgi:serine/threonine-protein kinase
MEPPASDDLDGPTLISAPPPNATSELCEGYRILEVIGRGGMGTVYKAEQVKLRRTVALKVLLERFQRNREVRERFHREALIMAQVNHPNIVQIFGAGQTESVSYFAMEYVDGASLATRILNQDLDLGECREIIRQTCNAISHLHSRNIIHRDIKPSNILINRQGYVKVTDFGISRARLGFDDGEFTQIVHVMGTPHYMAPELTDLSCATVATDLYALGMTFWRMFMGPENRDFGARLSKYRPELPTDLSNAVARCLEAEPGSRFRTILEARDAYMEAMRPSE